MHACNYIHLKPQIDIPFIFVELSILITVHTLGVHMGNTEKIIYFPCSIQNQMSLHITLH